MKLKKMFYLFLCSSLIGGSSTALAQGVSGYGQALGTRVQQNRKLPSSMMLQGRGAAGQTTSFGGAGTPEEQAFAADQQGLMGGSRMSMGGMSGMGAVGYQVHLLGQVQAPGTYRLPPSTRLDEAINTAGGLKPRASQRKIEVRRSDGSRPYDLMRFWNAGDLSQNPYLLDNDVIFVPFSEKNVEIEGAVKNGGVYEVSEKEINVKNLIDLAGGFTTGVAQDTAIKVVRYENGEKKLLDVENNESSLAAFQLRNGDIVVVPHVLTKDRKFDYNVNALPADSIFYPTFNNNVFIMGAVELPGGYPFNPHYSMREFVGLAGPNRFAKIKSTYIITADGKRMRGSEMKRYRISPGDTIVVPQRAVTSDNVIKWYNTLANSVITGFTIRELVK